MRRRGWTGWACRFAIGCGAASTSVSTSSERASTSPAPTPTPTDPATTTHEVGTAAPSPAVLEVETPADLASAIAGRLPTIELVPQVCGPMDDEVESTAERLCLGDVASGLAHASRRFVTSADGAVAGARRGNDVVFAALDIGMTTTRYSGHLWRWTLDDDRYVGLAALDGEGLFWGAPSVDALDFGILVRVQPSGGGERTAWLYVDGELTRLRSVDEDLGPLFTVGDQTYTTTRRRLREVVSIVRRDGPQIVLDAVGSYPRAWHLPLAAHFPDDRPLVVSAFPRGERTELHVLEPPAGVRILTLEVTRPVELRVESGTLLLRTEAEGWRSVDLTTGALAAASVAEPRAPFPLPVPRSIHAVVPLDDGVALGWSDGVFRLASGGVTALEAMPARAHGSCRCEDDDAVCGEATIAGGCTTTPELERIAGADEASAPPTTWAPAGRWRIDRLEPDLTRITRTSDGARIWLRVLDDGITEPGVLAQADDGAYQATTALVLEAWALRWGRSVLDAPVTPLASHERAFERPTLVVDFFAGRALPTADTTLPDAL